MVVINIVIVIDRLYVVFMCVDVLKVSMIVE